MRIATPQISWHSRQPIYSLDFQPGEIEPRRVVTASADANVRVWFVKVQTEGKILPEFAANLYRHTKPVNVVRFSPDGQIIASGADDGLVILWELSDPNAGSVQFGKEEEESPGRETWTSLKMLRGHLEDVYDISWSQDGSRLITGSVDNSAIVWDVSKGEKLELLNDHRSFVQGVTWDPLNQFFVTMSCDRSMRVYSIQNYRCVNNVSRLALSKNTNKGESQAKQVRMFHDDSMKSFFRRLTYTPDGQLLIVPSGCLETGDTVTNTTFIFSRLSYSKPVLHLPGPSKPTIAVRCNPNLYKLRRSEETRDEPMETSDCDDNKEKADPSKEDAKPETEQSLPSASSEPQLFDLPYRIIFAVASEDSILFYDTQQSLPFALVSNIHYSTINDISWSSDGQWLSVASTDGYISFVNFEPNELGELYVPVRSTPKETTSSEASKENTVDVVTRDTTNLQDNMECEQDNRANQKSDIINGTKNSLKANPSEDTTGPRRIQTLMLSSNNDGLKDTPGPLPKEPRRIATTMLSTPSNNHPRRINPVMLTSSQASNSSGSSNQPRRVALTTLPSEPNK